ncbi:hypothetical protein DBR06_SOUSAS35210009 [Sousa chinensis]|uniref:Uncharacterized protein n=1 Tax=Sousa chinensis TaxID=103600 RepID=A0A484H389_SOUCH|nr:hypothetical protein DBR06_SOUSAS35210009 [Sousa chinensis]
MATVTLWRARCILAASLDNPHANSLKNKGRGARDPRGRRWSPRRRRRWRSGVRVSPARRGHRALPRGRDAGPWGVGIEALRMVDSAEKRSVIVFPEQPKALEVEVSARLWYRPL